MLMIGHSFIHSLDIQVPAGPSCELEHWGHNDSDSPFPSVTQRTMGEGAEFILKDNSPCAKMKELPVMCGSPAEVSDLVQGV